MTIDSCPFAVYFCEESCSIISIAPLKDSTYIFPMSPQAADPIPLLAQVPQPPTL